MTGTAVTEMAIVRESCKTRVRRHCPRNGLGRRLDGSGSVKSANSTVLAGKRTEDIERPGGMCNGRLTVHSS